MFETIMLEPIMFEPIMWLRLLNTKLLPVYNSRNEEFKVVYLKGMFDWMAMAPKRSTMIGSWASRCKQEAPHSFVYTQRRGALLGQT